MLPTNVPVLKSILELKVRSPKSLKTLYIFTAPLEKRSSFLLKLSNLNYANLNKMYILLLAVVFLSFFNLGLNCRL